MRISRTTAEVMEHLSTTQWKSALELQQELSEKYRRIRSRRPLLIWIISLFDKQAADAIGAYSIANVYLALEVLHSEGLVEWRWRDEPPEALVARGGHRRTEWRITQDGHRVRASLPKIEKDSDWILIPAPA